MTPITTSAASATAAAIAAPCALRAARPDGVRKPASREVRLVLLSMGIPRLGWIPLHAETPVHRAISRTVSLRCYRNPEFDDPHSPGGPMR